MSWFCRIAAILLPCLCAQTASAGEFPRALKNGLGFDLPVGQRGNVHLTIHERANPEKVGLRFQLRERSFMTATTRWSVGPVVKLVRSFEGQKYISVYPQLRATMPWRDKTIHAFVHYGFWSPDGRRTPVPKRAIQAQVSLRF